jgi:uncharacterized integral membrane protein
MKIKALIVLLLLLFVAVFSIQNTKEVEIVFFSLEFKTRRAILILGALYIGFIIGRYTSFISSAFEKDT